MTTTINFESFRQEWLSDVRAGASSTTELATDSPAS